MIFLRQLFTGRIGRLAFILGSFYYIATAFVVFFLLIIFYVFVLTLVVHGDAKRLIELPVLGITIMIYVFLLISSLSLSARRLNDVNRPTWFCAFAVIPFVNIPLAIYMLLAPGSDEDNMYGPPMYSTSYWDVTKLHYLRKKHDNNEEDD
jgi:uncharacterized membrane protein YhaH (DUF805 family)